MKHYQIIATIGPATEKRIFELVKAGATGFRINSSHLSLEGLSRYLMELEKAFQRIGNSLPVWLDLQGTKLRLGMLQQPKMVAEKERVVFVANYQQQGDALPLPHRSVFEIVEVGDKILLDDGKIEVTVEKCRDSKIQAIVQKGGVLKSFKGVTLVGKLPAFTEITDRDHTLIEQTRSLKFLGYAISYLQDHRELQLFRELVGAKALTAKIEREDAMRNLVDIANIADSAWLCRGDLGTNAKIFDLHRHERQFAQIMSRSGKPYFIAGEVLQYMTEHSYPTRSEIAHLGLLLELGFSGVVLSDETAIGKYPIETVAFCNDFFEYLPSR